MASDRNVLKTDNRETERKEVRLSVRAFVEFLLRSGDLDSRWGGWADREAMQAGARIHRKIQRSRGSEYHAEVPLSWIKEYPAYRFVLEGRADGIYSHDGIPVIEEIKGVYGDIQKLNDPMPVHLAQARCYAWIYASLHDCAIMQICMTYVQMETEETRQFRSEVSFMELEEWFLSLIDEYRPWADFTVEWEKIRNLSLSGLAFPFPYRPGQQKLTADIYRTIMRKKQVFVQAPTGVGKTISAVYPAVRALGEGLASRVFYLTARTITRTVAEDTLRILKNKGMACKCLTLTAKEKICIGGGVCDPSECPYARGHFDRVNRVLYEVLRSCDHWNREFVQGMAEQGKVCPYELQSDLAFFSDVVIGDYNYAFDPSARLRQFFGDSHKKTDVIFLIDEAHNLVERGRDMFSADLYREEFLSLHRMMMKEAGQECRKIAGALRKCGKILLQYRKSADGCTKYSSITDLHLSLLTLSGFIEDYLSETGNSPVREQMLAFYFRINAFLSVCEMLDERYIIYGFPVGRNDFFLKLFCVDPSSGMQEVLDKGRSAVFFSATLVPVRYFQRLLSSRGDEDYAISVPSPFPVENRCYLIGGDVSTKYSRRNREEYEKIAAYIQKAVSCKDGNYMVYFPSYQVLEDVYDACVKAGYNMRILKQSRDMCEEERESFLRAFSCSSKDTLVGFGVMGGVFAEGIDLRGDRLIGVIVVGTGLPQVQEERELLREYYGKDGFAYAYRNPGMNKVLQAAGRVIRTENDKGWILLLDERFLYSEYNGTFPPSWEDRKVCTLETVQEEIEAFWTGK